MNVYFLICDECGWHGPEIEALSAPNPFEPAAEIYGCPRCKAVDSFVTGCDEPGCKRESTCGTPTPEGYRRTCYDHWPEKRK